MDTDTMDIRYAPELLDEVVGRELLRREAAGDAEPLRAYHVGTDRLYQIDAPTAREAAFARAHAEWFKTLGLAAPIDGVVAEFPALRREAAELLVERASGPAAEEADLLVREGGGGRDAGRPVRSIRLRLQTARFERLDAMPGFLRHELQHVDDMLRPAFGYRPIERLAARPAEENLVRMRMRLLWNVTVAGAIERLGRAGAASRADWERAAARVFPAWPPESRAAVVRALWNAAGIDHPALVRFARRPEEALAFAGVPVAAAAGGPAPGAPCPLCAFPTFDWATELESAPAALVDAIRADFPDWTPGRGACRQCVSGYPQGVIGPTGLIANQEPLHVHHTA